MQGVSLYAHLDRGDGICKHLKGNLCGIYDERPLICRVDDCYEQFFKGEYSRDEFYNLNYQVCNQLKTRRCVMFLNSLNSEEKNNFMKLAVAIMKADGVIEESEKQIISVYAAEMQIPVCNVDSYENVDAIIDAFAANSTMQTKRIVFLELLALALADGNYAQEEKTLVQQVANAFGIDKPFIEKAISLEDAYTAAYMSLANLVEKGE